MKLTENEKVIFKKIRAMKPHDRLIVEKKGEKDPTEFRLEIQSTEYLKQGNIPNDKII